MRLILIAMDPVKVTDELMNRMSRLAPDCEILVTNDNDEINLRLAEVEVCFGWRIHDIIGKMPNLRWYQQYGAGADWLLEYPEQVSRDFILTNASGVHAVNISEHIMAYLLVFARGFKHSILDQQRHIWPEDRPRDLFELAGKRALILGMGAIGARCASVVSAFDVRVVGMRKNPEVKVPGVLRMVSTSELQDELPFADFIINTLPLTDATTHMFTAHEFALMKRSAIFVNIGRGGSVKEDDMVAALRSGQIAGAGLDVFDSEPLPENSPLWDLENVIITPHYAGLTPHYESRLWEIFLDNLGRYIRGEKMRNIVDKVIGY